MTIIMTQPEFKALPEEDKWAIAIGFGRGQVPDPKPSEAKPEPKPEAKPEPKQPIADGFWN